MQAERVGFEPTSPRRDYLRSKQARITRLLNLSTINVGCSYYTFILSIRFHRRSRTDWLGIIPALQERMLASFSLLTERSIPQARPIGFEPMT